MSHNNDDGSDGHDPTRPVGPGNPPRSTQFRKGQSGNPKGRPKPRVSFDDLLGKVLDESVTLKINGKSQEVSGAEGLFRKTQSEAFAGDTRSRMRLLDYLERYRRTPITEQTPVDADGEAVLRRLDSLREAAPLEHTIAVDERGGFELTASWLDDGALAAIRDQVDRSETYQRFIDGGIDAEQLADFIAGLLAQTKPPQPERLAMHENVSCVLKKEDGSIEYMTLSGGQS